MEEESWSSCGNHDYLTPWDLSSLSTKSSPMLSMMLGVEGEDGPSWNSWSPSLMCMNIIFNVSSPLLPQFPSTSSCTKSWSQLLLHIVVASFNSSLSIAASSSQIFLSISRTEHVLKHCSTGLVVSCSKIGQKPAKTKFLQNICANVKMTNN